LKDDLGKQSGIGSVLFVCNGNTCRSAIAAALFTDLTGGGWVIESAGLHAVRGSPASPGAIWAMNTAGLDVSLHRSKRLEDTALDLFPLILVMTAENRRELLSQFPRLSGRVYLLAEMAGECEDINDPYEEDFEFYIWTTARIKDYLERGRLKIEELVGFSQ
jgi:protein-tyrosine-phosphatase